MKRLLVALLFCLCSMPADGSGVPLLDFHDEPCEQPTENTQQGMEAVVVEAADRVGEHIIDAAPAGLHPKKVFPKDVWQIIAHELAVDPTGFHVLLTLRLTHPYFKEITNEIPGFSRQLPINATKFLITKLLPEHADVALYAQRILEEALKIPSGSHISGPLREILLERSKNLWALRYGPGMSPALVEAIATEINLALDRNPLNTLRAMRLGYAYTSRKMAAVVESIKAIVVISSMIPGMYLVWSNPYRVPDSCNPIYILQYPDRIGGWWEGYGHFRTLYVNLGLTGLYGAAIILYGISVCGNCCSHPLKYNWGRRGYDWMASTLKLIDMKRQQGVKCGDIGRGALLCGVVIGVAVGSYFLLADTYAVPWQRLTLGEYIKFAHGYYDADLAGCCSMRTGFFNVMEACSPLDYNIQYTPAELALPAYLAKAEYLVPYGQMFLVTLPMLIYMLHALFWDFL